MSPYTAPGVYVEEISTLPPSVAEVATAVPAFIGYTCKHAGNGVEVAQVRTLREYEERFGQATPTAFKVEITKDGTGNDVIAKINDSAVVRDVSTMPRHLLWYAIDLYFRNGGGRCYIVSIGNEADAAAKASGERAKAFQGGLLELTKYDEPTLVVMPEIVGLDTKDYGEVVNGALTHCIALRDRFAILDVRDAGQQATADFRNIGLPEHSYYGAAYYPYLDTTLTHLWDEATVTISPALVSPPTPTVPLDPARFQDVAARLANDIKKAAGDAIAANQGQDTAGGTYHAVQKDLRTISGDTGIAAKILSTIQEHVTGYINQLAAGGHPAVPTIADVLQVAVVHFKDTFTKEGAPSRLDTAGDTASDINAALAALAKSASPQEVKVSRLADLKSGAYNAVYNLVRQALAEQRIRLPPSAAMAGVYARTDRERGVWKAPANVALVAVVAPEKTITADEQGALNVDVRGGKSINCIRAFPGKGVLVWGARTLAGNDNEWRYVPVRRLFITIEESVKQASAFAVFEPNDATTWLKVKGMIEGYLYGLWEKGALQGSKPESAYYVHVGLGRTMTPQDILDGRLIVEVGIAAVRPAEFIVLRFMHKLAEA